MNISKQKPASDYRTILFIGDAAKALDTTPWTLRRMCRREEVPFLRNPALHSKYHWTPDMIEDIKNMKEMGAANAENKAKAESQARDTQPRQRGSKPARPAGSTTRPKGGRLRSRPAKATAGSGER